MATPTLDEFLSAARADNPGVSDGQLASYWLKTYAGGKGELPKSEATAGGLIRSFGSSAIDTVGSAFQGGGEVVASGLRAATGNQDIRAANPLRPVTDAIRGGMSEGDKLASQDTFKGDITSPSTIELPKTAGGWAHAIASGFGSLSSMILPGAMAATGARGMIMAGAATGALTTGGAAADEVRQNVQKAMEGQSPDQLAQSIPAYREARLQGMDDGTARQKVENDAAILATTIAGAAGAVGGAFNAKVLEDVVAKRGLATLLGKASASKAGQIGIGAGIGTVAEGLQEGLEKVGQNVGENLGLGRPAMENATRDTAGDVIMGGLIGGVTGGAAGAITQRPAEAEAVKEKVERAAAVQDIATAPNVDAAIEAFGRATKTTAPAVEFGADEAAEILRHGKNRLAALEAISQGTKGGQSIDVDGQMVKMPDQMGRFFTPEEKQEYDFLRRNQGNLKAIAQAYGFKPAAPVDTGEAIPYDYSTRQQMYPALPAPEMPSGRNVLVNDTDPQLTRPEQIGDREAAINFEQRQREQADSDRDLGITRRQRITLDEAGNIVDAPAGDRQFLSLVRREARPHAAAAIEAHAINPTLTEAVLAAPDMGPKAERAVFEAITNGTTGSPETRDILARHGLADANGQGQIPLNPAPPGQQPAGDTGSERRPAENGTQGTGADAAADNRSQGVSPFQMRGKWLHDMHAGALNLIARNSKSLVERAKARAELDRRNPNREFDRAAHDARKRLWRAIVQAGGISEKEAADIGIDPRSLGGYRMSGLITPNGMRGDILARFLAESGNGWLRPDQADDDNAARQLVADLLAREAIGTPDEQNRYHELLAKKHGEAVAAAIDTLPEVEQAQVADYDDSVLALAAEEFDAALDAEPNMTVADAMRALGFTDEEIRNAEQPASEERETVDAETGRDEPGSPSGSGEGGIRETERGEGAEAGERGDQEGAATAVAEKPRLYVQSPDGRRFEVESYEDASRKWLASGETEQRARNMATGAVPIVDQDGKTVALMGVNGRVTAFDGTGVLYAPPEADVTPADDDAWLKELFVETAAETPVAPIEDKADLAPVRAAIAAVRASTERDLADWQGRAYKQNKNQVELRGDGPSRRESLSIGGINEARRNKAIAALQGQLAALEKIEAQIATPEGARALMRMLDETWARAVEGVKADAGSRFKTAGDLFEYLVLQDQQPARGAIDSNPLSRALRALKETPKTKTRAKLDGQKRATAQAAIDAFNADDAKTGMEIVAKLKLDALKEVGAAIGFSVNFTENATRYRERLATVADRLTKSARDQSGRERKLFDRLSSLANDWDRMADHTGAPEGSYDGKWMTHPDARKYLVAELDKLKGDPDFYKVAPMVRKARPRLFDAAEAAKPVDTRTADEKMADFRKMVAEQKADRVRLEAKLERLFLRDGGVRATRNDSKTGQYILLTAGTTEAPYRVTSIDDEGPSGHRDYNSIAEAANEFAHSVTIVDGPAPRAKAVVTPQVASPGMLKTFIGIAADSIEQLRKVDVDRVLTSNPKIYQAAIAQHIKDKRPDLADEVDAVLEEAAPAQEKGAAEPKAESVSRETPKDEPLASRSAPTEAVADMFGYTDADEDTLLLDMDAQERAEYEKSKPRGVSWLDHAKERYSRINADYRGGRGRSFISATYGADSPWQESARNRDGDDLQALRSEAARLEKDAPAYLYVNEDGTARITVFDARDVPKRMLAFAERNNLKTDVVVSSLMLQSGKAMPEVNRAAGAKYAAEMTNPYESDPFASRSGYSPPYTRPAAYRFSESRDPNGLPVFRAEAIGLANARVKDALGVPKGGRAIAFDIYDPMMANAAGNPTLVGSVLVHMDAAGKFASFRNISIKKEFRDRGYYHGEGTVLGMLQHNGTAAMEVYNIQSAARGDQDDALPFWKKIGTTILNYSTTQDVDIEGNISLARYMDAGKKRGADYGKRQAGDARAAQSAGNRNGSATGRTDGRGTQSPGAGRRRTGLAVAEVQRIAQGISPRLVRVVQSTADLPDAAARFKSDVEGIRGVFIPATDEIYLIADNLHSPMEVAFVVMHEGLHRGLRQFFGNDIAPILSQIANTNAKVRKAAAEYQAKYNLGRLEAIEEVLADMANSASLKDLTGWDKLVAFIRKWMASLGERLGFELKFSDDMVELLVGAAAQRGLMDEPTAFDDAVAAKYSEAAPTFYSALSAEVGAINARALSPAAWWQNIESLVKKGAVKADEVNWSGVEEWLSVQEGKVTKDAFLAHLREGGVKVETTVLGGEAPYYHEESGDFFGGEDNPNPPKFANWQLPGGEDYREVLLTLPERKDYDALVDAIEAERNANGESTRYWELVRRQNAPAERNKDFRSTHWDQPNVVAHFRADVVTGADGKRYLRPFEFQSDWGQKGKKEGFNPNIKALPDGFTVGKDGDYSWNVWSETGMPYATGAVTQEQAVRNALAKINSGLPPAPFVTKTEAWLSLAIKRAIRMAADEGLDGVVFANGEQMAGLFDLSKQVQAIRYEWSKDTGLYTVSAKRIGERQFFGMGEYPAEKLEEVVGKDLAKKMADQVEFNRQKHPDADEVGGSFEGLDLKVGGEGMRAFYDKILPNVANDVLRKLGGGKVGPVKIDVLARTSNGGMEAGDYMDRQENPDFKTQVQPGFPLTDTLRARALGGLPLFSRLSDQLGGMNKGAGTSLFQGAPELDKPLTDAKARKAYDAMFDKLGQKGLGGLAYNWNESEINEDGDLKNYAGRDRMYTAKGQGGSYKVSKADFVRWLMSDAPFDPAKIQQDAEWRAEVDAARQASGLMDDAPMASRPGTISSQLRKRGQQIASRLDAERRWNDGERIFAFSEDDATPYEITSFEELQKGNYTPDQMMALPTDAPMASRGTIAATWDMLQSASTPAQARALALNLFDNPNKFNLWDKTIGTQLNKARKNEWFRAVFDGLQAQQDSTAAFAIEAEAEAADVLARMEGIGEVKSALKSTLTGERAKDLRAVSKAIFSHIEGKTGVKQFVFTDYELKRDFDLNDRQIGLYRQARAAIDRSLDRYAQSLAIRTAQKFVYTGDLHRATLDETAEALSERLTLRRDVMVEQKDGLAGKELRAMEDKIEALDTAIAKLPEIRREANRLKDRGYAPAMRFGDYAVTATQDGETTFFTMVDTKTQANLLKMRLSQELPGATIRVNQVDKESYKLFGGVDPATVELFARFMEVEETDVFKKYVALATSSRSALKHMLERKGIAGFSDNLPRVMAAFITSNSRAAARNIHAFGVNDAMEAAQKNARGDVSEEAAKLVNYMNNPTSDFAKVRGFMFAYFMGGSVSSALVNLTQPVMMTAPYLSQFAGAKTAGIMARASKAAATGKVTGATKAALERAEAEGITDAHEYHQLMQEAEGGGSVAGRALMKAWGSMFSAAERFNRRITFLAAFETAQGMTQAQLQAKGVGDAYEFAKDAVVETQGIYARHNRPNWARNPVGALALTFKQYSIAWLEFFARLPRKQQLLAVGLLILVAGIEGLPFAEDLEDLIDTIGQRMGYGTNSKKALRTAATNLLGEAGAQFALHGISGLAGLPMDVAGRLGMGNLIPGTKLLNPSTKEKARELAEIAGPAAGLAQKAGGLADGNFKEAMPKAFADAAKAWEMIQTGEYRDTRGRKVMDVDGLDALMKMIGFQPRDVAANTRYIGENMRDVDIVKRVEAEIAEQWAEGIRNKDVEESRAARERLMRWNAENPDLPIKITFAQVLRRVKQASLTRDERFMKTAPPELRRRLLAESAQ